MTFAPKHNFHFYLLIYLLIFTDYNFLLYVQWHLIPSETHHFGSSQRLSKAGPSLVCLFIHSLYSTK